MNLIQKSSEIQFQTIFFHSNVEYKKLLISKKQSLYRVQSPFIITVRSH